MQCLTRENFLEQMKGSSCTEHWGAVFNVDLDYFQLVISRFFANVFYRKKVAWSISVEENALGKTQTYHYHFRGTLESPTMELMHDDGGWCCLRIPAEEMVYEKTLNDETLESHTFPLGEYVICMAIPLAEITGFLGGNEGEKDGEWLFSFGAGEKVFSLCTDKIEKSLFSFLPRKEDTGSIYDGARKQQTDPLLCRVSAVVQQSVESVRLAFAYMQQDGGENWVFSPKRFYLTLFQKEDKTKTALSFFIQSAGQVTEGNTDVFDFMLKNQSSYPIPEQAIVSLILQHDVVCQYLMEQLNKVGKPQAEQPQTDGFAIPFSLDGSVQLKGKKIDKFMYIEEWDDTSMGKNYTLIANSSGLHITYQDSRKVRWKYTDGGGWGSVSNQADFPLTITMQQDFTVNAGEAPFVPLTVNGEQYHASVVPKSKTMMNKQKLERHYSEVVKNAYGSLTLPLSPLSVRQIMALFCGQSLGLQAEGETMHFPYDAVWFFSNPNP